MGGPGSVQGVARQRPAGPRKVPQLASEQDPGLQTATAPAPVMEDSGGEQDDTDLEQDQHGARELGEEQEDCRLPSATILVSFISDMPGLLCPPQASPARSSSPSFPGGSLLRYGPPSLLPAPTKTSPPQETVPLPAVLPSLPPLAGLTHRPARRHRGGAPVASTPLHPTPDGRLLPRYRSHA